ncbi:MAG: inorganic diphosphatase [Myxococcota bacterium]
MVNLLRDLPLFDSDGHVRAVVEVPRGSAVKFKYDEELGVFTWSRALPLGVRFPFDFGFLPQTLSGDGDALDVLILTQAASHPGVVVPARAIAALRVEQMRAGQPVKRNDRILVVPEHAHRRASTTDLGDLATRLLDEIQAFFAASLALTGKTVRFCGWADAAETAQLISDGHAAYRAANP